MVIRLLTVGVAGVARGVRGRPRLRAADLPAVDQFATMSARAVADRASRRRRRPTTILAQLQRPAAHAAGRGCAGRQPRSAHRAGQLRPRQRVAAQREVRPLPDRDRAAPTPAIHAPAPTRRRVCRRADRDGESYSADVSAAGSSTCSAACAAAWKRSAPEPGQRGRSGGGAGRDRRRSRAQAMSSCAACRNACASRARTPRTSAKRCAWCNARFDAGRGTEFDTSRARAQLEATLARAGTGSAGRGDDASPRGADRPHAGSADRRSSEPRSRCPAAGTDRCRHARRSAAPSSRRRRGRTTPARGHRAHRRGHRRPVPALHARRTDRQPGDRQQARCSNATARRALVALRHRLVVPRHRPRARAHRGGRCGRRGRTRALPSRRCCWRWKTPRTRWFAMREPAWRTSISNRPPLDSATAARLARVRYEAGAADLFEVLDAERTQLQAQDAFADGPHAQRQQRGGAVQGAGGWLAAIRS